MIPHAKYQLQQGLSALPENALGRLRGRYHRPQARECCLPRVQCPHPDCHQTVYALQNYTTCRCRHNARWCDKHEASLFTLETRDHESSWERVTSHGYEGIGNPFRHDSHIVRSQRTSLQQSQTYLQHGVLGTPLDPPKHQHPSW